jgi:hypothetical protein
MATSGLLCIFGAVFGMFFALIFVVLFLVFPWQGCEMPGAKQVKLFKIKWLR